MRSEDEIKKCIELMKERNRYNKIFLHNNEWYAGYIKALEWVLQEDNQ